MKTEKQRIRSAVVAGLLAASCATPAPRVEPPATTPTRAVAPPVDLSPRTVSIPDVRPRPAALRLLEQTRFSLNVQDADLEGLVLGLGRDSPFNTVVDPGLVGTVTADFKDVSLREILDQLLTPRGYRYSVRGNMLRVTPSQRGTRTYRVDYPSYERRGTSDLSISGAIASRPDIGSGKSSGAEDTSTTGIRTTQVSDFWTELEQGLRGIVLGGSGEDLESEDEDEDEKKTSTGVKAPDRSVVVGRHAGIVTITAEPERLRDAEVYLQEVTRSTQRQVLIDVQILEIDVGDEFEFGVDWEAAFDVNNAEGVIARTLNPGSDPANIVSDLAPVLTSGGFLFGIATDEIGALVAALAAQRNVRVISTPRLATLNNHKALIKVVRNEVFFIAEVETQILENVGAEVTTEFVPQIVPVGVTLDITPQISEDGYITMHIHPSISEVVDIVPQPVADSSLDVAGSLPVIDLRETDTVMRVEDRQTILIGGLIQSRELDRQRKIPLLGDIPWLGQLFRLTQVDESRTELVILVTPKVLAPPVITEVRKAALESLDALDALGRERSSEGPWWRKPYGRPYGVEVDHELQ